MREVFKKAGRFSSLQGALSSFLGYTITIVPQRRLFSYWKPVSNKGGTRAMKKNKLAFFLAALLVTVLAGAAGADEKIIGRVKNIYLETKTVVVATYEGREV